MINVLELLRPVREKKIDRLEELADRLIAGENISPEVIDQCIRDAHREPGELQAIVERKTRAAELAKLARSGGPAKARLQAVDAEIAKFEAAFDRARDELAAVQERYAAERSRLKEIASQAESARNDLLTKGYMPPALWEKLVLAEREAEDASEAADAVRRKMPDLRNAVKWAEDQAARKTDGLYRIGNRNVSKAELDKNASDARAALDTAEASVPVLEKARDAARKRREETIAEVARAMGL